MPKIIRDGRVAAALNNLSLWRDSAKSQGATHLFPLIALLERGAGSNPGTAVSMNETPHEFEFWNKYFRVGDGDMDKPYFNPITLRRAESGFPHSNSATIRKNTFSGKWGAATRQHTAEGDEWSLSTEYADIFRNKVLTKSGRTVRVSVLDVAALLFRGERFPDDADAQILERAFRDRFPQLDEDYEKIFVFHPEASEKLFIDAEEPQDYDHAINSVLVDDVKSASKASETLSSDPSIELDDPILVQVQKLLVLGTSGVIFTGAPGTGKSYYAKLIANHLVSAQDEDVYKVQFHPSYGYEDFVEGYRPDENAKSGYTIVEKIFLKACRHAESLKSENRLAVLIVDEINRGDPARIFGELLTYIERQYRGQKFTLPFTGGDFAVPSNLVMLGTMNPYDRSVAQVDAAFVRRFDHIELSPSREVAETLLEESAGFDPEQVQAIGDWFETAQALVPFGIGHSFFAGVKDLDHLKLIWKYRMRPTAVQAIELNDGAISDLTASFDALVLRLERANGDA